MNIQDKTDKKYKQIYENLKPKRLEDRGIDELSAYIRKLVALETIENKKNI